MPACVCASRAMMAATSSATAGRTRHPSGWVRPMVGNSSLTDGKAMAYS